MHPRLQEIAIQIGFDPSESSADLETTRAQLDELAIIIESENEKRFPGISRLIRVLIDREERLSRTVARA